MQEREETKNTCGERIQFSRKLEKIDGTIGEKNIAKMKKEGEIKKKWGIQELIFNSLDVKGENVIESRLLLWLYQIFCVYSLYGVCVCVCDLERERVREREDKELTVFLTLIDNV